jgi:hypothetical protein
MAILQATRAKELGLAITAAKSWGLNRAIFYAAAKRGFKERTASRTQEEIERKPVERSRNAYFLGDEMAYTAKKGGRTYFTIGGESQTESDFKRQIERRFENGFSDAWMESLKIVHQYSREVLLSQKEFFEQVYRPRRDELALKWTEMSEASKNV